MPEKFRPFMEKVEDMLHDLKVCDKYGVHEGSDKDITPKVTLYLIKEFKRASGSEG